MNTTPESTQTRSTTTTGTAGSSRLRRGAAALALGVIGGGISIGAFGAVTGVGMPAATAQQQETPAQRCARQTAEYNQAQAALWKAGHPGEQLTGQPWAPFVCADVPSAPAPAPGGTDQGPSRTHTWDGFDDSQRQFGDDMALGGLGDPNRGLADRMNKTPTDTTGPSAGDSARSNVALPKPWATSVPATGGGNRSVNVVDTDQGQLIVDDAGRATGEVVRTDPTTGARTVERVADTAGRQVAQGAAKPSTSAKPSASARPSTTTPAAPVQTQNDQDDDAQAQPVASLVPIVPLAAAGAAAGAAGVLGAGRRGRGLFGGDGAPRATVRYPWGDEQTLFLLESAASDHTQRFDLDIPPGGRAVKRADGGVDVLDADGRVVRRVDPPWAFDAAGRPVKTWYEIDPVTGELIQIVEPGPDALYPILADPDKKDEQTKDNNDFARVANGNNDPAKTPKEPAEDLEGVKPTMVNTPADAERIGRGDYWDDPELVHKENIAATQAKEAAANKQKAANEAAKKAEADQAAAENQQQAEAAQAAAEQAAQQQAAANADAQATNDAVNGQSQAGVPDDVASEAGVMGDTELRNNSELTPVPQQPNVGTNDVGDRNDNALPLQRPDESVQVEKPGQQNRANQDSMSPYGDRISRDENGRPDINPLKLPDRGTITDLNDGSQQVVNGDRTTRYFPIDASGKTTDAQLLDISYDKSTNVYNERYLMPDGSVRARAVQGRPAVSSPGRGTIDVLPQLPDDTDMPQPNRTVVTEDATGKALETNIYPSENLVEFPQANGQMVTKDLETGRVSDVGGRNSPVQGATLVDGPTIKGPSGWWPTWQDGVGPVVGAPTEQALAQAGNSAAKAGDGTGVAIAKTGGRAAGGLGGVLGAEMDVKGGMDPTEAYVTNAIGTGAGIALAESGLLVPVAALAGPVLGPVVLVGGPIVFGYLATKGSQEGYNWGFGE